MTQASTSRDEESTTGGIERPQGRSAGWLFLGIVALEIAQLGSLLAERRFPRAHDGYQYFTLQYTYLNGVATTGEIPQWMPFTTQGVTATWWYACTTVLLEHALFLGGRLLAAVHFLPVLYLMLFVDELVLLVGMWLLARRFLASPLAVFFVAWSAVGSAIWMSQPWWNLHLYYAIPLILHLLHEFVEQGRWRYLVFAANLLMFQAFTNVLYALPAITFMIFVYVASWLLIDPAARRRLRHLRLGWAAVGGLALAAESMAVFFMVLSAGTGEVVVYSPGRGPDSRTPLDVFLHYGGAINYLKWAELLLRVSPAVDYTLYAGMLVLPLAALGVVGNLRRTNAHVLATLILTYLFGISSLVTIGAYHAWPLMPYFRHIGLTAVVPKIFLCLVAGTGVDWLLRSAREPGDARWIRTALGVASAAMALVSLALAGLSGTAGIGRLVTGLVQGASWATLLTEAHIRSALAQAAILAAIVALLFAGMIVHRWRGWLVAAAMLLAVVDLVGYKATLSRVSAFPLGDADYALLAFEPMPWVPRRCPAMPCRPNPRSERLRVWPVVPGSERGYWTMGAFLYEDELASSSRVDYWLRSFDDFFRAYWGEPLAAKTTKPRALEFYVGARFPDHPAALKLAAATEDKIQVFSTAFLAADDAVVAAEITRAEATGDRLFVTGPPDATDVPSTAVPWNPSHASAATRLRLPYRVERFDANHVEVSVDVGPETTAWLQYSDAWHPDWQATVNGRPAPVFKANLAYKGVPLERGMNRVQFRFAIPGLWLLQRVLSLMALGWLVGLAVFVADICRPSLAGPFRSRRSAPRVGS